MNDVSGIAKGQMAVCSPVKNQFASSSADENNPEVSTIDVYLRRLTEMKMRPVRVVGKLMKCRSQGRSGCFCGMPLAQI